MKASNLRWRRQPKTKPPTDVVRRLIGSNTYTILIYLSIGLSSCCDAGFDFGSVFNEDFHSTKHLSPRPYMEIVRAEIVGYCRF